MTEFINEQCKEIISQLVDAVCEQDRQMVIITEASERQLSSKQDYALVLTINNEEGIEKEEGDQPIDIVSCFDGHGSDLAIDIIRSLDLKHHFAKASPAESIQNAIDQEILQKIKDSKTYKYVPGIDLASRYKNMITEEKIQRSGSSFSLAKIYRNEKTKKIKIVTEWLGDSPILVFVNGELVFRSEAHSATNEKEINRLLEKKVISCVENATTGFKVTSENNIEVAPGKYISYARGKYSLAMTRSLGHNRLLGDIDTQKHIIECSTFDEVKVITFSDGVGDVLHMDSDIEKLKNFSAKEIVELAERRWKQEWNIGSTKTKFPANGYDDCCCSMWWQIKK